MTIRFAFQEHVPRIQTFVSPFFRADTLGDKASSFERTTGWQFMREFYIQQTICQWLRCSLHIFAVFELEQKINLNRLREGRNNCHFLATSKSERRRFYFLWYQRSKSVCMCYVGSWKRRPISRLTKICARQEEGETFECRGLSVGFD